MLGRGAGGRHGRGSKVCQVVTFIFLAVVLFEDIKTHFTFHRTVKQENKKGYIGIN